LATAIGTGGLVTAGGTVTTGRDNGLAVETPLVSACQFAGSGLVGGGNNDRM